MMNKLILFTVFLSLSACSSKGSVGMDIINQNPRGISILNVKKAERVKAYREAERHCAKYYKVPRMLTSVSQEKEDEYQAPISTMNFECLKPSN